MSMSLSIRIRSSCVDVRATVMRLQHLKKMRLGQSPSLMRFVYRLYPVHQE